jgi:WD40 repeat protein
VLEVAFSPDGCRVITTSADNLSRVWDAAVGQPLTPPVPHVQSGSPSAFSGSGRYWLTLHPKFAAYVWDLHRDSAPPALLKPFAGASSSEVDSHGSIALSRGSQNLIRLSPAVGSGGSLHPVSLKTIPIQAWFDGSAQYVLLEGEFGKVQVWESASRKPGWSAMPLTPPIQSQYALTGAEAEKVTLSTVAWPVEDLVNLAQLLSGNELDGNQGWNLLEADDLRAKWEGLNAKSSSGLDAVR